MPRLQARNVILRPVEESDLELMREWRNSTDYIATCTTSNVHVSVDELRKQIDGRPFQFVIEHVKNGPIGTIYANKPNLVDHHLFITTFLDAKVRHLGYGPLALILAIDYSFENFSLRKIYFDVYTSNQNSRSCFEGGLQRLGFEREGTFKDHRFYEGVYLDMVRFSIFSESKDLIRGFITRANSLDNGVVNL